MKKYVKIVVLHKLVFDNIFLKSVFKKRGGVENSVESVENLANKGLNVNENIFRVWKTRKNLVKSFF